MTVRAPSPEVLRQIRAAVAGRQYAQAQQLARRELETGAEHPQLFHLRAIWLEEQGKLIEALADLDRAHALDPTELGVVMALGNLLERLNRRLPARQVFQRATELRPDLPGTWLRLGWACENLGEVEAARAAYGEVLRLDSKNAQTLGRLALIASQQGEWSEARTLAARALAINPNEFPAQLARLRADVREGKHEEAEEQLARLLGGRLADDDRYLAHKELGALRHQQQRYADAFAAWATGNEIAYRRYALRFAPPRGSGAVPRQLAEYFSGQTPWPRSKGDGAAGPARGHVFLLGFARSGTTLLEQVLAAHPDVAALEEKEVLTAAMEAFGVSPEAMDALRDAGEDDLKPLRDDYWRTVAAFGLDATGKVLVDKSPFNALRLPIISRLFPDAKILFAVRDPRDVLLSCFRTPFQVNGIVYELLRIEDAGRFYADYMAVAELFRQKLPLNLQQVRHEDILDEFEGEVRKVCEFIGIDLQPHMLEFQNAQRKVATPSAHQLRAGLSRASVGQWTHYRQEMRPAIAHLGPWIERFGYQP